MATAIDIMHKDPTVIFATSMPSDILVVFLEAKVTVLPVLNSSGTTLGFLSEVGLVKILLHQSKTKQAEPLAHHGSILLPAPSVLPDDPLPAIVKRMLDSPTHRVLVCDGSGKLLGIISPKDILRLFAPSATAPKP